MREQQHAHRCPCVIITVDGEDHCPVVVTSPDEPFCETCDSRHPDHRLMGSHVTTITALAQDHHP